MGDNADLLAIFEAEMAAILQTQTGNLTPLGLIEVIQQAITFLADGEQSPWRQQLLIELGTTREQLHRAERARDRAIAEREQAALAALALLEDIRSERDQARAELRKFVIHRSQPHRGGGRAPFGYHVGTDRELVPVPEQQTAIRHILRLRMQGMSLRDIAKELAKSGVIVSPPTIARVIKDTARGAPSDKRPLTGQRRPPIGTDQR